MNTVLIVEIWIVVWPIRIERIKIVARRAEITQGIRVVVALKFRVGIEGDVMVNELTEVSEACGNIRVVQIRIVGLRLRLDHQCAQRQKIRIVRGERRKIAKHPPKTSFVES